MLADRLAVAARAMDAGGGYFHRHRLRAGCLLVDLDAAEAGQQIRDLAWEPMRRLRLSIVAICTERRSCDHAASINSRLGMAREKSPPRLTNPKTASAFAVQVRFET
jgi:hypothetical protein